MSAMARLIPIAITSGLFATQGDKIQELSDMAQDASLVVSAKAELGNLSRGLMTQIGFDSVPPDIESNFDDFVRSNLHNTDGSDPSLDPWGNSYELRVFKDEYEIFSRGPDGNADSDDDIWVSVPRR